MALEDIKNKILADARSKARELLDEAESKKKDTIGEFARKAREYAKMAAEKAAAEGEGVKRGIVIDAKTRRKSDVLKLKRELIGRVFSQAKSELIASEDYPELVSSLVRSAGEEARGARVVFSREEKKLDEKFVRSLAKELDIELEPDPERGAFSGGVVLKQGDMEINLTVDVLLEVRKEDLEREVAKILFGDGK